MTRSAAIVEMIAGVLQEATTKDVSRTIGGLRAFDEAVKATRDEMTKYDKKKIKQVDNKVKRDLVIGASSTAVLSWRMVSMTIAKEAAEAITKALKALEFKVKGGRLVVDDGKDGYVTEVTISTTNHATYALFKVVIGAASQFQGDEEEEPGGVHKTSSLGRDDRGNIKFEEAKRAIERVFGMMLKDQRDGPPMVSGRGTAKKKETLTQVDKMPIVRCAYGFKKYEWRHRAAGAADSAIDALAGFTKKKGIREKRAETMYVLSEATCDVGDEIVKVRIGYPGSKDGVTMEAIPARDFIRAEVFLLSESRKSAGAEEVSEALKTPSPREIINALQYKQNWFVEALIRIRFGVLCALEIYRNKGLDAWAKKWLADEDRHTVEFDLLPLTDQIYENPAAKKLWTAIDTAIDALWKANERFRKSNEKREQIAATKKGKSTIGLYVAATGHSLKGEAELIRSTNAVASAVMDVLKVADQSKLGVSINLVGYARRAREEEIAVYNAAKKAASEPETPVDDDLGAEGEGMWS